MLASRHAPGNNAARAYLCSTSGVVPAVPPGSEGELMDVFAHEHIVLRAGLNRRDALHIEEVEVEQRTCMSGVPRG